MRYLIKIAYDGRPFCGWQRQPNQESIQLVIESALERIAKVPLLLIASGRTDRGVHALGQFAHFDAPESCRMLPLQWLRALNSHLPNSIRVMRVFPVSPTLHARFSALSKHYRYTLFRGAVLPPLLHGQVWHLPYEMDWPLLEKRILAVQGTHDFRSLCARRGNEPVPLPDDYFVRHLFDSQCLFDGDFVHLDLIGEGFLYKMVRMIVAAAVESGRGRLNDSAFDALLAGQSKAWSASNTAPADGLSLHSVRYPKELFL